MAAEPFQCTAPLSAACRCSQLPPQDVWCVFYTDSQGFSSSLLKKYKKIHGWLGERGEGEGRSARSWLDEWPSTQLWPPALLALGNNVKQHRPWMTRRALRCRCVEPCESWHYTERLQPDETWGALKCFLFFFRHLSKWAWERAVSSAVSQSVYRHGWLITEREIYGYNEGENRPRVKSCRCAPLCVCPCCLMSRSRKSQEEEGRGRARE